MKEMSWKQLQNSYQPSDFSFERTDQINGIERILGQDEAIDALKFALRLEHKGCNIYIEAESENLYEEVEKYIKKIAKTKSIPDDICYVYNFKNEINPQAILMECGDGEILKEDIKELKNFLKNDLLQKLKNAEISLLKNKLISNLEYEKEEVINELEKIANENGFIVKMDEEGIGFIPIHDGEPIMQSTYEMLNKEEKKIIKANSTELYNLAETMLLEIKKMEAEIELGLKNTKIDLVIKEVNYLIKMLKIKYRHYNELNTFFDGILEDLIDNAEIFLEEINEKDSLMGFFPWINKKGIDDVIQKYEVNLFINNSNLEGAPVICNRKLSYSSLIGQIILTNEFNNIETDILNIKSGLLHKARGGYLLLRADDIIDSIGGWLALKTALKDGKINIKNPSSINVAEMKILEPEPISLPIKVIIVGDSRIKYLLQSYDKDFKDLFKCCIEFKSYLDYTKSSVEEIAFKIQEQCKNENLFPLSCNALLYALRYTQRLLGRSDKVSTNITILQDLIREANYLANGCITEQNIKDVIYFREMELNSIRKEINKTYQENRSMITVENSRIGQINGLAVYSIGNRSIGQPMRITASTYKGKKGVINIEKVSDLSGNIHNKGIEIIEGFIGEHYAQNIEPNLSCKVCMEQSYSMVDGDSASSAELYAILSSLSQIPIKQNLAVTGSINQHGDIQPVGGVTEKIEGFFWACKQLPNNEQGVIIPYQNQIDIVLSEEVLDAVKNGSFHIYPIKSYKEGIELLTGKSYEVIESKIMDRLKLLKKNE